MAAEAATAPKVSAPAPTHAPIASFLSLSMWYSVSIGCHRTRDWKGGSRSAEKIQLRNWSRRAEIGHCRTKAADQTPCPTPLHGPLLRSGPRLHCLISSGFLGLLEAGV